MFTPIHFFATANTKKGHFHSENQDACISYSDERASILAIADGVSSCSQSKIGSKIAVKQTLEYFKDSTNLENLFWDHEREINKFLEHLKQALSVEAVIKNVAVEDLSTTLLFAVVYKDIWFSFQLGDGAIFAYENGEFQQLPCIVPKNLPNGATFSTYNLFRGGQERCYTTTVKREEFPFLTICTDGGKLLYVPQKEFKDTQKQVLNTLYNISKCYSGKDSSELISDLCKTLSDYSADDATVGFVGKNPDHPIFSLSHPEKALGEIPQFSANTRNRFLRMMDIYLACSEPKTSTQLRRLIHLKEKPAKRLVSRLIELGLISRIPDGRYVQSTLI